MVYWCVKDLLDRLGWTRYRLVRESGLAPTVVYRVARKNAEVKRIDGTTLDTLCDVLKAEPGDLLVRVPGAKRKRGKRG